ncbi:MAG: cyclase family protein [Anaerolineae bacterium]|nr:cyclase family protein [Anaerolineae bacterium]
MNLPGKIIDNTHTLTPGAPNYAPREAFSMTPYGIFERDGYVGYRLTVEEHFGTHIDAPLHFLGVGHITVDELPVESLIGPVVVVDVRDKAGQDADYQLAVSDLLDWEARYGQIPAGAIVVMFSGWQDRWHSPGDYVNVSDGVHHFPGFSVDAVNWLLSNRDIKGIGLDTLSFDHGPSESYPVHKALFGGNKWGLENLCNLDKVPPRGGVMVIGPLKHAGGSGGPARVYTFLD